MGQSNGIHARRCVNSSHQWDITEISWMSPKSGSHRHCYEHRLLAMTSRMCCFVVARYASRRLLRCSRLLAGNVDPRSPASHDDVERRHGTRRHGHARTDVTHVVAHHHRTRRPVQRKICQLFCYCVLCVLRGETWRHNSHIWIQFVRTRCAAAGCWHRHFVICYFCGRYLVIEYIMPAGQWSSRAAETFTGF